MPINKDLYNALIKKYGPKKGKEVYFGMENKGSKAFKKGLATAKRKGRVYKHVPKTTRSKKKKA